MFMVHVKNPKELISGKIALASDVIVKSVVCSKTHMAICFKDKIIITDVRFKVIFIILDSFLIKSAFWES